jgi:hypothetical protein
MKALISVGMWGSVALGISTVAALANSNTPRIIGAPSSFASPQSCARADRVALHLTLEHSAASEDWRKVAVFSPCLIEGTPASFRIAFSGEPYAIELTIIASRAGTGWNFSVSRQDFNPDETGEEGADPGVATHLPEFKLTTGQAKTLDFPDGEFEGESRALRARFGL